MVQVRLNECIESALMNDGGKHLMCFPLVCVRDLIGSPVLGLRFSISTVKYLMTVFVRPYLFQGCRRYVICEQDYDNSRGIGFQEVCVTHLRVIRILSVMTQFEPLWNYITVRVFKMSTISRLTLVVAMATNVRILRR